MKVKTKALELDLAGTKVTVEENNAVAGVFVQGPDGSSLNTITKQAGLKDGLPYTAFFREPSNVQTSHPDLAIVMGKDGPAVQVPDPEGEFVVTVPLEEAVKLLAAYQPAE